MTVRPFEQGDAGELWRMKQQFERGLGSETGGDQKAQQYADKLTAAYRERYLAWVSRCQESDSRGLTVAEYGDSPPSRAEDAPDTTVIEPPKVASNEASTLAGYVFVLPESMAMIWDAAVLNEIYVDPAVRGTGVADELIDAALAYAHQQDLPLDRLVLDVDPDNGRAVSFYERHGFESWGDMVAREL